MMGRIVTATKAYEWLLAVSHTVLIATRYQQVEDKARKRMGVEKIG